METVDENFVYSRIGMALVSAQRVEHIASQIVDHITDVGEVYGIFSELLNNSRKAKKARKMLGEVFQLLKLNPKLIIEDELDAYLKKRNLLVHGFWKNYLNTKSTEQAKRAVDFCYDFGRHSDRLESFFKGFVFFLALYHVKHRDNVDPELKKWDDDFDYFMESLTKRTLNNKN